MAQSFTGGIDCNVDRIQWWYRYTGGWTLLAYAGAYLVILVASLYKGYFIFEINPLNHLGSDPERHWVQGIEALRFDPMTFTDPIMYQLYIGAMAKLSLKIPPLVAFYTTVLGLLGPWLWYRFFRELQSSKLVALWGWAVLSMSPSWIAIYAYFMQETLLIPMLGWALYTTWRCRRKATISSFAMMILVWIAAGLTRGICIPLAALVCLWLWLSQEQKVRKACVSILVLLFVLGPLVYRSYQTVGFFAPNGVGDLSFIYAKSGNRDIQINYKRQGAGWGYGFACPSMGLMPFAPLSDWTSQRSGVVKVDIDMDKGRTDWLVAHEQNELSLSKYLWITKENLAYIFFSPSWPDTNPARPVEAANYLTRWVWAPLTLIGLVMTLVYWRRLRGYRMLGAIILAWFIVQVIIPIAVNEGRYRKPFEGLLVAQFVLLFGVAVGRTSKRGEYEKESSSTLESKAQDIVDNT